MEAFLPAIFRCVDTFLARLAKSGFDRGAFKEAGFRSRRTGEVYPTGSCHDLSLVPHGLDDDFDIETLDQGFLDHSNLFLTREEAAARLGMKTGSQLESQGLANGAANPSVEAAGPGLGLNRAPPIKLTKAQAEYAAYLESQPTPTLRKMAVLNPAAGYEFTHTIWGENGQFMAVLAHNREGREAGRVDIDVCPDYLHSTGVLVEPEHRRQGLASAMYAHAETVTGKRFMPSQDQTKAGRALWAGNAKNPQFGKSESGFDGSPDNDDRDTVQSFSERLTARRQPATTEALGYTPLGVSYRLDSDLDLDESGDPKPQIQYTKCLNPTCETQVELGDVLCRPHLSKLRADRAAKLLSSGTPKQPIVQYPQPAPVLPLTKKDPEFHSGEPKLYEEPKTDFSVPKWADVSPHAAGDHWHTAATLNPKAPDNERGKELMLTSQAHLVSIGQGLIKAVGAPRNQTNTGIHIDPDLPHDDIGAYHIGVGTTPRSGRTFIAGEYATSLAHFFGNTQPPPKKKYSLINYIQGWGTADTSSERHWLPGFSDESKHDESVGFLAHEFLHGASHIFHGYDTPDARSLEEATTEILAQHYAPQIMQHYYPDREFRQDPYLYPGVEGVPNWNSEVHAGRSVCYSRAVTKFAALVGHIESLDRVPQSGDESEYKPHAAKLTEAVTSYARHVKMLSFDDRKRFLIQRMLHRHLGVLPPKTGALGHPYGYAYRAIHSVLFEHDIPEVHDRTFEPTLSEFHVMGLFHKCNELDRAHLQILVKSASEIYGRRYLSYIPPPGGVLYHETPEANIADFHP